MKEVKTKLTSEQLKLIDRCLEIVIHKYDSHPYYKPTVKKINKIQRIIQLNLIKGGENI